LALWTSEENVDILQDVMTLMNPMDEAEWHREGLFKKADLLECTLAHHHLLLILYLTILALMLLLCLCAWFILNPSFFPSNTPVLVPL
jgi:hypothetical protein